MIYSQSPNPSTPSSPLLRHAEAPSPPWQPPSQTYSVPRRFDMATLLTVSFAYSLLFALLRGLDASWVVFLFLGGLTVAVGIAQALAEHTTYVRRASVITGGVYCIAVGTILLTTAPMTSGERILIAFCLVTGPGIGYLAGALDAGLFLLADMVRRHLPDGKENSPSPEVEGPIAEDRHPH